MEVRGRRSMKVSQLVRFLRGEQRHSCPEPHGLWAIEGGSPTVLGEAISEDRLDGRCEGPILSGPRAPSLPWPTALGHCWWRMSPGGQMPLTGLQFWCHSSSLMRQAIMEASDCGGILGPSCPLPCIGTLVSSHHKTPTVPPLPPLPCMTELPPSSLLLPPLPLCLVSHSGQSNSVKTEVRSCQCLTEQHLYPQCLPS